MFLSRNKKSNVYPCRPKFYYIKMGFKGSKLYKHVFVMFARARDDSKPVHLLHVRRHLFAGPGSEVIKLFSAEYKI